MCLIGQLKATHMFYEKNNSSVVEFFGLPGSGKTYAYNYLQKSLPKKVVLHTRISFLELFFWTRVIFIESIKVRKMSLIRFKLSLLRQMLKKEVIMYDDKYILDEGWLQRILSFYESKISSASLLKIYKHVSRADVVIFFERGHDHYFSRYNNPDNTRAALGSSYLSGWKKVLTHNHEIIKEFLLKQNILTKESNQKNNDIVKLLQ